MSATQHTLDVRYIPTHLVRPNPRNIRSEQSDLSELILSIEQQGIQDPLLVFREAGDDESYMLLDGEGRLTVAQTLELDEVPCLVRSEPDGVETIEIMFASTTRRPLSPIDEGRGLLALQESGRYRTLDEIAGRVHRSKTWVAERIRMVTDLPASAQDLVAAGDATIQDAVTVAGLTISDAEKFVLLDETDERHRQALIIEAVRLERQRAARAEAVAIWGDQLDTSGALPKPGPWGRCEVGTAPGQLNLPEGLAAGAAGIVPIWDDLRHQVTVFCTTPEVHPFDLFAGTEPDGGWDSIPEKAEPIGKVTAGWDWRAHRVLAERDDVRDLRLPWGIVKVTVDPGLYRDKRRKGYVSEDDLIGQYVAQQKEPQAPTAPAGSKPAASASPLANRPGAAGTGGTPSTWQVSDRVSGLLEQRIAEVFDPLPAWAKQLLVLEWLIEPAEITENLGVDIARHLRDVVWNPAHLDEDSHLEVIEWALQACVDAGEPPDTLDTIRTRIDVIRKGEGPSDG